MDTTGQMNENKEKIISLLMENQTIMKCLFYKDNRINILKQEDLTDEEKQKTRQQHIFRYRKIPADGVMEQETWISLEYGDIFYMGANSYGAQNPYFKLPDVNIYLTGHSSLDDNQVLGSRIERIEESICNIFHNKITLEDFGKSYLVNSKPLFLPNSYIGRQITIRFVGKNV